MSRSLRPRNARPSYATMIAFEDENGAGPSTLPSYEDEEGDSGSEFAMEGIKADSGALDSEDEDEDEEGESVEDEDEDGDLDNSISARIIRSIPPKSKARPIAPSKAKKLPADRTVSLHLGPSLPRGYAANKMYALPTPSIHHRHRAIPLLLSPKRVERLKSPPKLFCAPQITATNNLTFNDSVQNRVNKAWGYNVGSGPLWELLEDRGWHKEATVEKGAEVEKEADLRPRVYADVRVQDRWEILSHEGASGYLPSDTVIADDGSLRPAPPVVCFLGPFGKQTRLVMNIFESHKMSEFIPESKSHVFNAGAPVWGLDWCPIHFDDRSRRSYKQYLAVAPFPSRSHSPEIGVKTIRPSKACIQIWTLSSSREDPDAMDEDEDDQGQMRCEMVLCLDSGPAYELKWCPLPAHDVASESARPRKLGVLAGTFEDGSVSIYAVPDPADITPADHGKSVPIFVKLSEPLLRLELEETSCWSIDWANSELIAVGCTNGNIAIYDIGRALKSERGSVIFPTHYLTIHQSAIRALAWIRTPSESGSGPLTAENPTVIASGGYDGVECLTDIRDPTGNTLNRTRDVINSVTYAPFSGGPITIDHENTVKSYSAAPSMLGRGHTLLESGGPIWSAHASDYHPQLAVGSTDGSCVTTNALRRTRRGGSVPFFVHKIYQLDYSRKTDELRMLEMFLPQETPDKPTTIKAKAKASAKTSAANMIQGTGVWPPSIGVHRVTWNCGNGLQAASLLASATASGICRVDLLEGQWLKGKIPYTNVERIRKEDAEEGTGDEDEEDELDNEE